MFTVEQGYLNHLEPGSGHKTTWYFIKAKKANRISQFSESYQLCHDIIFINE